MTAIKRLEVIPVEASEEAITDPGVPESVDVEASQLIRLTLNKLEEGLSITKKVRVAARRVADSYCLPPYQMLAHEKK